MAVGTRSRRGSDQVYVPTSASRLDIGGRLHLNPTESFTLSAVAGYRMADFSFGAASDGSTIDGLAAVAYRALRVGGAVELRLTDGLAVFAEGAYLNVTQSGQIATEFFPGASAAGMEAPGGVRYSVSSSIDLQASGVFTHYALTFRPEPDSLYIAAGATDRYAGGALTLRYRM